MQYAGRLCVPEGLVFVISGVRLRTVIIIFIIREGIPEERLIRAATGEK